MEIRPGYARALVNKGIAYSHTSNYEKAITFYLSALCLTPNAAHIWNYINIGLAVSSNMDLLQ